MFLTQKRDGTIKGRMVYNGKPTREWLSKDDAASPTAFLESIILTAMVDAKEGRDVMSADVPNAFIQTSMPEIKDEKERVILILSIPVLLSELLMKNRTQSDLMLIYDLMISRVGKQVNTEF